MGTNNSFLIKYHARKKNPLILDIINLINTYGKGEKEKKIKKFQV